jgi:hypothetical protein
MNTEHLVLLTIFAAIGVLVFVLYKTREEDVPHEDVTKPALFLRVRNDGTYFINVRTFVKYEYGYSNLKLHTYPRFHWEEIEAGDNLFDAEQKLEEIRMKIKSELDYQESRKTADTLKKVQL